MFEIITKLLAVVGVLTIMGGILLFLWALPHVRELLAEDD